MAATAITSLVLTGCVPSTSSLTQYPSPYHPTDNPSLASGDIGLHQARDPEAAKERAERLLQALENAALSGMVLQK